MARVNIYIVTEDLLSVTADVCVCNMHRSKDLSNGVLSKKVSTAAGPSVQMELDSKAQTAKHGTVLETKPGRLSAKFQCLYFMCLRTWKEGNDEDLQGAIERILDDAGHKKFTSVALPPLGTGGLKYPPEKVAFAIMQAVMAHSIDNPDSSITSVTLSLFQQKDEMSKAFADILTAGVALFESAHQEPVKDDNAQPQGDQNGNPVVRDGSGSSIFASPVPARQQRNILPWLFSFFGRTVPVYSFYVGPATVGVGPHLNVRQRGLGFEGTIGVTFSIGVGALPAGVHAVLSKLFNRK